MQTQPRWEDTERRYVATVTQSSTSAPSATIHKNTLKGIPVWARTGQGTYTLTLSAAFLPGTQFSIVNADQNVIGITRTDENTLTFTAGDDGVINASLDIKTPI